LQVNKWSSCLKLQIIEGCRSFSDHFEFVYTPELTSELTSELTPELIKEFYFNFNWLLAVELKVMMTIELCILN
jgi:hypothetical protein